MSNYVILTDSGTDFTKEMIEELDVELLDLTVTLEGEEPRLNSELDLRELYAFLREKKNASTSAVNLDAFIEKNKKSQKVPGWRQKEQLVPARSQACFSRAPRGLCPSFTSSQEEH